MRRRTSCGTKSPVRRVLPGSANGWDVAKDACGLIGSLMMAIPWFLDFAAKRSLRKRMAVRLMSDAAGDPVIADALRQAQAEPRSRLDAPDRRHLLAQSAGAALLVVGFGIGLCRSFRWL